jgi:exodeoxyribonuclease V alpha subunit
MAEKLSGVIERVTFHNPENGFVVLRVIATGRGQITVVGSMPQARAGESIEAQGAWINDRDHGLQFKAEEIRTSPPHSREGLIRYLGSGLIKGIGPHYAKKIVDVFGEKTLAVIDESPSFLKQIKGLGPRRLQRIRDSWQTQKNVRDLMIFLHAHGVGASRVTRIYRTYGPKALELVRANPYRLAADVWGIGFQTADELAARLGIDRASPMRARAVLFYLLQQLSREGHVGFPEEQLLERATEMTSIPLEILRGTAQAAVAERAIVRDAGPDGDWIYLRPLHEAECSVARLVCSLYQGRHPLPAIDAASALRWVELRMGIELAETQKRAIERAASSKVMIITGGPGVGKTTIVRGLLEIFIAKGMRCALCAPTGRAAKRLQESTGRDARTIHRLLEFDPQETGFKRNLDNPLDVDLLVVDEASMVDISLMDHLLRATPAHACLVLVGDVDQLPSVGPGTVLHDLIGSGVLPVVRLTEIFRQANQSWIVRAAHAVQAGDLPASAPPGQGDFYFVSAEAPEAVIDTIMKLIRERIPARYGFDPVRDVQVLTPMNRSVLGARNLNAQLQEVLNPSVGGPSVERFGWIFRQGDKVLQTVNNYKKEVFNGDIGTIARIDAVEQELTVDFDARNAVYDFDELDELGLAYAMTIHKSQGSEYPAVILPVHTQHYIMLQRNLLYTGITRGRKLVVLVGTNKALALAVSRQDTSQRFTALRRRLQQAARFGDVNQC